MSIRRITSILVGIAFVGGSLSAYLFAPWKGDGEVLLLLMFAIGMILTWKGIWGESFEDDEE